LNYNPSQDLMPVAQVAKYEFALAVGINHPSHSVPEFISWAKGNRSEATFGTIATGSLAHLLGTMLAKAAGIELQHIPYKGVAPLEIELMHGQIAAGIGTVSDLMALHRAGRIRILATSGAKRSAVLPDVPTFRELGYPSLQAVGWHAVYAPAGTPQRIVDQLSIAIDAALEAPSVREKLLAQGLEPTGTTPQALSAIMAADIDHWRSVIKTTGFTAE